jgi:hypothetical protein
MQDQVKLHSGEKINYFLKGSSMQIAKRRECYIKTTSCVKAEKHETFQEAARGFYMRQWRYHGCRRSSS